MHHPPVAIGVRRCSTRSRSPEADRPALRELMAANPQVKRIVAGHVHRGATGGIGGCPVFVCASSYLQLALDLRADERDRVSSASHRASACT